MRLSLKTTFILLFLLFAGNVSAQTPAAGLASQSENPAVAQTGTAGGDTIYAAAKSRLLQIRTLLKSTGNQASIGSGFQVSADGLVVTNYHVISQAALEPSTYALEFVTTSGERGTLELLAFDIVNDLAVVRLPAPTASFFEFSARALKAEAKGGLQKGERVFSMGNPLDLGFTIVEGTYNSLVVKSYGDRIHFSGAINPGMSGGPAVDAKGQVVGINVSKRLDGDLVSFLVPARFAVALLDQAIKVPKDSVTAEPAKRSRVEIGRQLQSFQTQFIKDLRSGKTKTSQLGSFAVTESAEPWLTCWARSNAEAKPRPRFLSVNNQCNADTSIFLAGDLITGQYRFSHSLFVNDKLSSLQFPRLLRETMRVDSFRPKRFTAAQCKQHFIQVKDPELNQRITMCARAYRDVDSIYDLSISMISQNGKVDGLVSELVIQGVSWDNGLQVIRDFIDSVRLNRGGTSAVKTGAAS